MTADILEKPAGNEGGSRCAMRIYPTVTIWLDEKSRPLADAIDELIHYSWWVKTEWINLAATRLGLDFSFDTAGCTELGTSYH